MMGAILAILFFAACMLGLTWWQTRPTPRRHKRRMSVTAFDERGQSKEFTYWEGDE